MYYEGSLIISLALFSLFQLVKEYPYLVITTMPHFWFAAIQIFFWCFTTFNWTFYDFLSIAIPTYKTWISYAICYVNYPCYAVAAIVFLCYPKMYKPYARPIYH